VTWLKTSDDFPDQCADLSDAAYRTHHEALTWAMRRENAGRLPYREVRRFAESTASHAAVQELVEKGFWKDDGTAYQVIHHMEHQPEPEVIAKRRELAAERQRKSRLKKAGITPMSQRDTTRDRVRDNTRDPGRVGSGRDGTSVQGGTSSTGGKGDGC
jgi:hypothetical protein